MEAYFLSNDRQFLLYQGDATEVMSALNSKCDVVFADPPYFLSRNQSIKINGEWKKVLHFDPSKPLPMKHHPNLKEDKYTFMAKIKPLSDFIGIK